MRVIFYEVVSEFVEEKLNVENCDKNDVIHYASHSPLPKENRCIAYLLQTHLQPHKILLS